MCGLAGLLDRQGAPIDPERLTRMGRLIRHRGPDDSGTWCLDGVGLVHRRLSIIDLSERGHQPMTIEGRTIVYNGEIYNYQELRAELEGHGHSFVSDTDTEVLVRAYLQWGQECVNHFNGMWAFAIYEQAERRLFCSRDRFGIKPFYYLMKGSEFRFASEPKALLGDDPELRRLHPQTMARFLAEGMLDDQSQTFYQDILTLPAGHNLVVGPGGLQLTRYWSMRPASHLEQALERAAASLNGAPPLDALRVKPLSFATGPLEIERDRGFWTAVEAFRALLADAVRLRLRSDVPVGTCLSGGLDSTSIVCLASSMIDAPVSTFSSIYPQPDCSEARFVDAVVEGCSTRATRIEPTAAELPEIFESICWAQDEPTAGPGLYSQWKVMQAAQGQVKVLLDGQGGDELLAGYHAYFPDYIASLAARRDRSQFWKQVEAIEELTGRSHQAVARKAWQKARWPRFLQLFRRERPGRIKPPGYVTDEFARWCAQGDSRRVVPTRTFENRLNQRLYNDLTRYSIPALLRYEDRNSMAHSIEARTPFLDYRLVEFCFDLPIDYKLQGAHTKRVLRRAMAGLIPREVMERRDKLGYPTPAAEWFRTSLRDWVHDRLTASEFSARGILDQTRVLEVYQDHQQGNDRSWELWRFLAVDSWMRQFIEGAGFAQ